MWLFEFKLPLPKSRLFKFPAIKDVGVGAPEFLEMGYGLVSAKDEPVIATVAAEVVAMLVELPSSSSATASLIPINLGSPVKSKFWWWE